MAEWERALQDIIGRCEAHKDERGFDGLEDLIERLSERAPGSLSLSDALGFLLWASAEGGYEEALASVNLHPERGRPEVWFTRMLDRCVSAVFEDLVRKRLAL